MKRCSTFKNIFLSYWVSRASRMIRLIRLDEVETFYFSSQTFPYIIKFWTKLDLTKFPYYYLANYIDLTWFVCICNIFSAKVIISVIFYFSKEIKISVKTWFWYWNITFWKPKVGLNLTQRKVCLLRSWRAGSF